MLVCCEDCWICCAPCSMACTHEDRTERARHPDASWTCCRLLREVTYRDAIQHALHELEDRMGAALKDGEKMPEGWLFVREMLQEYALGSR